MFRHIRLCGFVLSVSLVLCACASFIVTPPFRAAAADTPKQDISSLIARDDKDDVPPGLPYGWYVAEYVVITRFDDKALGKPGALLGAAITGDFEFPKEVDLAPGEHNFTLGVMTGCGLMELDMRIKAEPGKAYSAYGIVKNSYTVSNGTAGGGCQSTAMVFDTTAGKPPAH